LEAFLFKNVYRHPKLIAVREQAAQRLQCLFEVLTQQPERLPTRFQKLSDGIGLQRSVGTYLAGMTDRFCEDAYSQLIERNEHQALDWYAI
jgi:dGTPase